MFHRVHQYRLIKIGQQTYRPRAYGDPQPDGTWRGWFVFFPTEGGAFVAAPSWETKQITFGAFQNWAAGLSQVYLEGALRRALERAQRPLRMDQLADAEYAALLDAERLGATADVERTAADVDDADAEEIMRAPRGCPSGC